MATVIDSISARSSPLSPISPMAASQQTFLAALGRADPTGTDKNSPPEERARETARQFVAQALIHPLLKQLRESSNAAPPFAPTQAEKQFRALQDVGLAHQIAHASHFPLIDRLARDLLMRSGIKPPANPGAPDHAR